MLRKFIQSTLVIAIVLFVATPSANAQSIMKVNGNPCVGNTMTFVFIGPSCSSVIWNANGGTILNQSNTSIDVKWNSTTPSAYVQATYSSCSSGGSGMVSSSTYTISNTVTPSVSIVATQPNAYPTNTVTFTATPVNGGSTPNYSWLVNGSQVSSGTSNTFLRSNLVNGNTVSVRMTSGLACVTASPVNSNTITSVIPVANAGADVTLVLPQASTTLNGSGSDADGSVAGYKWRKVSGPGVTMPVTNTANLSLSNLVAGTYVFELVVWDNLNYTSQPDLVTVTVSYPPNNYNWVKSISVVSPNKTDMSQVGVVDKMVSWSYFDGLGRPMQNVEVQASPNGKDIVQPIAYDQYGREAVKYLPYVTTTNDGYYKDNALKDPNNSYTDPLLKYRSGTQYAFYQTGGVLASDQYPYAETRFEASPLNRVMEQGAPGSAWQPDGTDNYTSTDRTIKKGYEFNSATEVILWTYIPPDATHPHGLVSPGQFSALNYYPAERLYKNKTKDEEHHEVIEYVNLQGQTILKKVQVSATEWASTYYVYNDKDQLVVVLQPMAVKTLLGN